MLSTKNNIPKAHKILHYPNIDSWPAKIRKEDVQRIKTLICLMPNFGSLFSKSNTLKEHEIQVRNLRNVRYLNPYL